MNEKDTVRAQLLNKYRDSAYNRLLSYSSDYLMTKPKAGFESEWSQTKQEIRVLDEWREEYQHAKKTNAEAKPSHRGSRPSPGDAYNSIISDGWTHLGMSKREPRRVNGGDPQEPIKPKAKPNRGLER